MPCHKCYIFLHVSKYPPNVIFLLTNFRKKLYKILQHWGERRRVLHRRFGIADID